MAVEHANVIEAMGVFVVDPNAGPASVLALAGNNAGFNPVGAYNGVGDYTVLLAESRGQKVAFLSINNGVVLGSATVSLDPNVAGGFGIGILVGGALAAPVDIAGFSMMVYNMPSGL